MSEPIDRPWYVDTFDDTYLSRYAHRDAGEAQLAIDTLVRLGVLNPGLRTLDLCCGAGRHLAALRTHGIAAVGFDLSPQLLRNAASLAAQDPGSPAAKLVRGDMRRLAFRDRSFDAVVHMFTAFGYFETDAENQSVLADVARVLVPGGRYTLDVFNSTFVMVAGTGRAERTLPDGCRVIEDRSIDPVRKRVEKTTLLHHPATPHAAARTERRFESVRMFTREELAQWLTDAGFEVTACLGNYDGSEHDPGKSPRLWFVARRRG